MKKNKSIYYGKLVRDKIPEIVKKDGGTAEVEMLDDASYKLELHKKLKEELDEYLESESVEELADLTEVILALVGINGLSYDEFTKVRLEKVQHKGAFNDKIYLKSILK